MFDNKLTPQDLAKQIIEMGKRPISYSQLAIYQNCPHSWKLKYIDKIREDFGNIYTLFGSAIHTIIQEYLQVLYYKTSVEADKIDFPSRLMAEMKSEFNALKTDLGHTDFTTKEEMKQFYNEGIEILEYLRRKRNNYFSKKDEKLIDVEFPILSETESHSGLVFNGFIDIILSNKTTGKIRIIDIKTSTKGWNKYEKANFLKSAQLVLYKKYYAKRYKVDPKMIDIEFFIVKRQLYENMDFPQKRIQVFIPASGVPTMNKAERLIKEFSANFDENGKLLPNRNYIKAGGKSCKYCEFAKHPDNLCPKEERVE